MGFPSKSAKMDYKKIVYTSGKGFFLQKVQKWTTKNSIHFWEMGFPSKKAKMDHKKMVYTYGEFTFSQNVKN